MSTQEPPSFIGKGFDQVAFVVKDLDEAQQTFGTLFGVDRWSVWNDQAKGQVNKVYRGQPEDFGFSCGYAYAGDTLIELCHHDHGGSVYKEWLDSRGGGMHHIGFRVSGPDEFSEAEALYAARGVEMAMGGERQPGNRYAYYDTVEQIGCFTEIYYVADYILEVFDRMKKGEIVQRPKPVEA
jgi:catechol 2,3-dioxygenase-like lactoylglutathione lyase family enzyme